MKLSFKHPTILAFAVLLVTLILCAGVNAADVSGQFFVTATSTGGCTFGTVSNLDFGSYNPVSGSDTTGSTTMTFTCVKGQAYSLYIVNKDGTSDRLMTSGDETLSFELYSDENRTQAFPSQAAVLTGTGTGTETTQIIYGTIGTGQVVSKDKTFWATMTAYVDY